MAVIYSENATHRAALLAAEQTRQAAITAAAGNATAIKNAELAFYRNALSSALANSCGPSQFTTALKELGVQT
jgi:hypothetical protein